MNLQAICYQVFAFQSPYLTAGGGPFTLYILGPSRPFLTLKEVQKLDCIPDHDFGFIKVDQINKMLDVRFFSASIEIYLCGQGLIAAADYALKHNLFTIQSKFQEHKISLGKKLKISIKSFEFIDKKWTFSALASLNKESYFFPDMLVWILKLDHKKDIIDFKLPKSELLNIDKTQISTLIITCAGDNSIDFYFRYFSPWYGKDEDMATGSALAYLAPLWKKFLHKDNFQAMQLSKNKAIVLAEFIDNVLHISGEICQY